VHLAAQILHRKSPLYVTQPDNVATLGLQLLGPYAFVFEWVGLVLLIVLVGVAYLMKDATPQERSNQQKEGQKVDD
jgi:NADH:ubiquinone oxidoreductase subunit 6 (subunit J)